MKVLILTQWFDPEPTPKGLAFAKSLKGLGHEVEVLTGFPNYPEGKLYGGYRIRLHQRENIEGVTVHRVALYPSHDSSALRRIANYLSFAISAAILGPIIIQKPDVMFVYHPPPTIGLPALLISWLRRVPFLYDVNDLWPDTLAATGMVTNRFALAVVSKWCKFIYSRASRITVLSTGFRSKICAEGVPDQKVKLLYNWCDDDAIAPRLEDEQLPDEPCMESKFNVMFAGTIGKAQDLDSVIDAARIVADRIPGVHFVIVGDGTELARLKDRVHKEQIDNVVFLPRRPISQIASLLSRADVLLVHLKDEPLFRITIPSKIQAYLASAKPILVGVRGDAADLVLKARAGISCEPGNVSEIADAVCTLATMSRSALGLMGKNGREYYQNYLSLKAASLTLDSLLQEMIHSPVAPEVEEATAN